MLLSELKYTYTDFDGVIFEKNAAEVVDIIKETILKHVNAKYIYLFGSYAYGTPGNKSDIDIYTVVPDDTGSHAELYAKVIGDLRTQKIYFVDLLFIDESKFNERKEFSFEKTICQKGKLLYEEQRNSRVVATR
ncbi:MAG: nucleotidyltransferase domain-containing protein [Spirochaetes bacterium]|nr:nucleotidyltransferase domain-containing protein [Spirochaetota bacterium]